MSTRDSITISSNKFSFFVANFQNYDVYDPMACLNLDFLNRQNYTFGITIGNLSQVDLVIDRIYHLPPGENYTTFDVLHKRFMTEASCANIIKFILFDVVALFTENTAQTQTFLNWLIQTLRVTHTYTHLYFVSSVAPWTLTCNAVPELMAIIHRYNYKNCVYFTTEGTHFTVIKTCEQALFSKSYELNVNCHYLMVGSMASMQDVAKPIDKSNRNFYYVESDKNANSGFLEITFDKQHIKYQYRYLDAALLNRAIVHKTLRLVCDIENITKQLLEKIDADNTSKIINQPLTTESIDEMQALLMKYLEYEMLDNDKTYCIEMLKRFRLLAMVTNTRNIYLNSLPMTNTLRKNLLQKNLIMKLC